MYSVCALSFSHGSVIGSRCAVCSGARWSPAHRQETKQLCPTKRLSNRKIKSTKHSLILSSWHRLFYPLSSIQIIKDRVLSLARDLVWQWILLFDCCLVVPLVVRMDSISLICGLYNHLFLLNTHNHCLDLRHTYEYGKVHFNVAVV